MVKNVLGEIDHHLPPSSMGVRIDKHDFLSRSKHSIQLLAKTFCSLTKHPHPYVYGCVKKDEFLCKYHAIFGYEVNR